MSGTRVALLTVSMSLAGCGPAATAPGAHSGTESSGGSTSEDTGETGDETDVVLEPIWELELAGDSWVADVALMNDGDIGVGGAHGTSDGTWSWVERMGPQGELRWAQDFPYQGLRAICAIGDDLVVLVNTPSTANPEERASLVRLDADGAELWRIPIFEDPLLESVGGNMHCDGNDRIAVAGQVYPEGDLVLVVDGSGNELLRDDFPGGDYFVVSTDVSVLEGGDLALAGYETQLWIRRLNLQGEELWAEIPGIGAFSSPSMVTDENRLAVATLFQNDPDARLWVSALTLDGQLVWSNDEIVALAHQTPHPLAWHPDGRLLVSVPSPTDDMQLQLVGLDSAGEIVLHATIPDRTAATLLVEPAGTLLVGGTSPSGAWVGRFTLP